MYHAQICFARLRAGDGIAGTGDPKTELTAFFWLKRETIFKLVYLALFTILLIDTPINKPMAETAKVKTVNISIEV